MRANALLALSSAVLLASFGCDSHQPAPRSSGVTAVDSSPADSTPDRPAESVELEVMSWDKTTELIAEQQGKVVVVDVWSTSCLPCMKEFPHLVKLHEDYRGDVRCVSFNVDYYGGTDSPEQHRDEVLAFLNKQGATLVNVLSSDPDEEVNKRLGIGTIPAVLVYDKEGRLAKTFHNNDNEYEGGFSYEEHVRPLVEQLLER